MTKPVQLAAEEQLVIKASSYLGGRAGEELEKEFEQNLSQGRRQFVIDFRDTEIINSIGISILIGIIERIMERKGTLRFQNLSTVNEEIFSMMGLLRYAPITKSEG